MAGHGDIRLSLQTILMHPQKSIEMLRRKARHPLAGFRVRAYEPGWGPCIPQHKSGAGQPLRLRWWVSPCVSAYGG